MESTEKEREHGAGLVLFFIAAVFLWLGAAAIYRPAGRLIVGAMFYIELWFLRREA